MEIGEPDLPHLNHLFLDTKKPRRNAEVSDLVAGGGLEPPTFGL